MDNDFGFSSDLVTPEQPENASIDLNTLTDDDQPVVNEVPEEKPATYDLNNIGEGFDEPITEVETPAEEQSVEAPVQNDPLETVETAAVESIAPEATGAVEMDQPVEDAAPAETPESAEQPAPAQSLETKILTAPPVKRMNKQTMLFILAGCIIVLAAVGLIFFFTMQ